jgi:hypothetical protein
VQVRKILNPSTHPEPYILNPKPSADKPHVKTLIPEPSTLSLNPEPRSAKSMCQGHRLRAEAVVIGACFDTLNPTSYTLGSPQLTSQSETPNCKPSTSNLEPRAGSKTHQTAPDLGERLLPLALPMAYRGTSLIRNRRPP